MSGQAAASPTPLRGTFEPSKHLRRVNGADYLPVAQRLAWLRSQHPNAELTTELVEILPTIAIFRAEVRIPTGGCATGWGSETPDDFKDYLEKAETKAIGRALAALGFGTQFCHDHEDGRPVDAPVPVRKPACAAPRRPGPERGVESAPRAEPPHKQPTAPAEPAEQPGGHDPMSTSQRIYLEKVAHKAGMDLNELDDLAQQRFGCAYQWLNRPNASALITEVQQRAS